MTVFYTLKEQKKGKARSIQQADAELLPFFLVCYNLLYNFILARSRWRGFDC
jgi:hypothetical protein